MGTYKHKHTSVAIALTVLALALAISSMTLPYYRVVDGQVSPTGGVYYDIHEFYPSYYLSNNGMGDYDYGYFEEVGGLFNFMWVLIWVWVFGAMFYTLRVMVVDESEFRWWQGGFIAGWLLAAVSVAPALVFALLIHDYSGAVAFGFVGSTTHDEWGPMSGWLVLVLACLIQVVAVLLRNLPAIMFASKGPQEVPAEVAARGDLPVR